MSTAGKQADAASQAARFATLPGPKETESQLQTQSKGHRLLLEFTGVF